ncbi:MAG: hypothetical protein IIA61_01615 [Candidatus Marinimicrobia bacterium]|nr:hypothetical protein [Candidatus Neomarinimicrobiota bacterium]
MVKNSHFKFLTVFLALLLVVTGMKAKNLTKIGVYNPPNFELLDIEIYGNFAYVPAGLGGLSIINISDPANPVSVAGYRAYGCEYGRIYAWHVNDNFAYGSGRSCGIKILDISTPSNPVFISGYGSGSSRTYEQTDGYIYQDGSSILFAAVHTAGVEIIDVSFPGSPDLISLVSTKNAWAVEVSNDGQFVYVADGAGGFKIIDVTVLDSPYIIGSAQCSGTAKDVWTVGNFSFVAVGAGGVDMFDISDPTNPVLVANYNTSGYASRVAVSGNLVAVSDWDDVEVLQWDSTPSLELVGYKNTGGRVMAINIVDDVVYSAEWRFFRTFRFGTISAPDIDVSKRSIDIPHTESGECRDTTLYITNNGMSPLEIQSVSIDDDEYEIIFPGDQIMPGITLSANIIYCPNSESGFASLTIHTNDPDESQISVSIEGNSPYGIESGETAPDFTLPVVNGYGEITLSKLTEVEGQIVLMAFFASW